MSNILIMNQNYIKASALHAQTYSSQITAAPATNVYDGTRRTRVWRTGGCFEVTSSNNKIIFRDDVTTDKTAYIPVAQYTSDATFLAAVDAALEAAGLANYTVSRDTTSNKIKITSDLSGGATAFQLRVADALFTSASMLGYSTSANLTGLATYTADVLKIHTSEWLKWDLGSSTIIHAFSMVGSKKNGLQISPNATIKLQGNTTDAWTSPQYNQTLDFNEKAIGVFNTDGLYTTGLRYWRLLITDASNPNGYVEVSNVYLGQVFEPTSGCVNFPFDWNFTDLSNTDRSEWGTAFSDIRQVTRDLDLKWFNLSKTEIETLRDFVNLYGTFAPFWICLDPNEVFSSGLEEWILLCRFHPDLPKVSLESPNVFSSTWSLREEV